MPALPVRKLATLEDEDLQLELARLDRADVFAADLVLVGAIPDHVESWARVHQSIDLLSKDKRASDEFNDEREEWAYYLGLATGLRLAAARAYPADAAGDRR